MKYVGLATQMGVTILAGVFIGQKLDEYYQTDTPWFTVVFSLLFILVSLYSIVRDLTK